MSTEISHQFYTVKELSQIIPISKAHIYALVREGKLNAYRFGKKILFSKKEIFEHLKLNTNENDSNRQH